MKFFYLLLILIVSLNFFSLEISEFIVTPTASEEIEIHNNTSSSISIGGYYLLIKGVGFEDTTQFPTRTMLADDYLSFTAIDMSNGLALPNGGAILRLYDSSWNLLDSVGYGHLGPAPAPIYNWSAARVNNTGDNALDFNFDATPTMGSANDAPAVLLGSGNVFLNEIYPDSGAAVQFIELYNNSSLSVDISNWIIICNDDYYVPASTSIAANGYFTVYENDFPLYFFLDWNENVYLLNSNGERIDQTGFNAVTPSRSWSVIPNGVRTSYDDYDSITAIDWRIADTTPNAANSASNTPPQFSNHSRTPSYPAAGQSVIVKIDITDDSGITADTLNYNVNNGSFIKLNNDSIKTNTYYYTIPGYNDNDIIKYYIKAIDDSAAISYSDTFSYTVGLTSAPGMKILFDYTKNETAGNADWIIDTDYPHPLPENPISETSWDGAISYWGFELDTFGYEVWTLPPTYSITYDTTSTDSLDLSNFDVFIITEPQNPFTSAEKQALFDFVRNGGGLFLVADHVSSDRDNDGWDSPEIYADLPSDSFGIHFQQVGEGNNNYSPIATSFEGLDSIYNGPFGDAYAAADPAFYYHAGTTMPRNSDPNVIEIAPDSGNTSFSMLTAAYWGNKDGKVVGMGDSSPADDGTGDPGDLLYDGWTEGVSRILILNATWWLSYGANTTDIKGIQFTYSFDNNQFVLNMNISDYNNYKEIRIYKKTINDRRYKLIKNVPSMQNIVFKENIENTEYSYYYKINAITKSNKEIFIDKIKISPIQSEFIKSNMVKHTLELKNNYKINYRIMDISGRIIKQGICDNGKINVSKLNAGKYYIEINNKKEMFTIIK